MGEEAAGLIIQNLFSHHPDGLLIICKRKNTIRYINAAARNLLGLMIEVQDQEIQFDYPIAAGMGENLLFTSQSNGRQLSEVYLADIEWQGESCMAISLCEVRGKQPLKTLEAPWSDILQHSDHAVAVTDELGNIVEWNLRSEELFGLNRQDVLGQPLWNVHFRFEPLERRTPEDYEQLRMQLSDLLERGNGLNSELKYDLQVDWPGNKSRFVESQIIPLRSEHGYYLASINRDVTRTRRLEESLRASEIRYRTLFNVSPVALWEKDLSPVKAYIDRLMAGGVEDIDGYFIEHPDELFHCIGLIRYIDINPTALELFEADSFDEMAEWLKIIQGDSVLARLRKEFSALARNEPFFEAEAVYRTLKGNTMYSLVKTSLTPGCEDTWSKVFVSVADITEYRRLEMTARNNETRYRNLFEESPIALYEEDLSVVKVYLDHLKNSGISDLNEYFNRHPDELRNCFLKIIHRDMNQEAIRLFEASNKNELRKKNPVFLQDSYRKRFQNELITLAGGSNRFEGEAVHTTLTGDTIYTLMTVIIPQGYEDSWEMAIVSFMDLTERRRVEEALRMSEERYRAVVESQTELILRYDADSVVTFVNNALCRFLNVEAADLIGHPFNYFVYADDISKVDEALGSLSPQNPMVVVENRNVDVNGKLHWFRWTNYRTYDENGVFVEHQSVGHEITDRVEMEKALRLSEERYRAVIEGQTDLIYRFLPDNTITFSNEAFARFVGLESGDLVGQSRQELTLFEDRQEVSDMMASLCPENPIAIFENRNINLAGEVRWFRWVNRRFYNEDGQFIEHQSVGHDITERVRAEEKLRRYADRLNVLHNIDQAILNLQDPESVFRVVLGYVADLGFDEYASIVVLDMDSNLAERVAISRGGDIRLIDSRQRQRRSLISLPDELQAGNIRIVEEVNFVQEEEQGYGELFSGGMASYLAVPLFLHGQFSGTFNMGFYKARSFDIETLEIARQVADSLAVAVQNARFHQADLLAKERAQNLRRATSAISSDLELEQVLENILVYLEKVVPYKRASIFLKTGLNVRLVAGHGFDDVDQAIGFEASLDDGITNRVVFSKKAVILDDALQEPSFLGWAGSGDTRGWMGVPLIWGQECIGYLAMDNLEPAAYSEEDGSLAQDFAVQAAIAIENARLYQNARRRAQEAETLARTATVVSATLDRQQLIDRILEQLEQVVPYDSASVLLLDGNVLEIVGGRGFGDMSDLLGLRIPLDEKNPDILVFRTRKPYILDDAPEEYEIFRSEPHTHTRSWLGVPLVFQNRFIGTLALDSLKPGFFTPDHARLATGFANQVATAMENVRLFEEARQQASNLRRRDSILQAVSHAAEVFLKTARWRDAIQNELMNLSRATDASCAFIFENFNSPDGEYCFRHCSHWIQQEKLFWLEEKLYAEFSYEGVGLSRWRKILQSNRTICAAIEDLLPDEREMFKKWQIRFVMVLPIFVQGEWWGTIGFLEALGVREWSSAEVDAIRAASDILAAAIQRERTEDALLASQKLADLGTLAAGVAHELNSPLQVITGSSEGLLKQINLNETVEEDRLKRNLEMINRSGWRSAEIVRSLLAYTRSSGGELEEVNLNDLIKDTLLLIEHQLRSWSNITVTTELLDDLPYCRCNHNQVTQVLINLMTNARDAMPEGGSIHIQTDYLSESQYILLKVSDTGVGIPDSIRGKIFSPFFTTKPLGQGTGLGLSIVMGIVDSHGGQVSVDSVTDAGTTFSIRIPVEREEKKGTHVNGDDLKGRYENIL